MNEKLQYATMLEIPVNTCSVTFTPAKKKKSKKKRSVNHEAVKEELLNKINAEQEESAALYEGYSEDTYQDITEEVAVEETDYEQFKEKRKNGFKFSVVGVQLCVVGLLIAAIFLTNAFYPDSGINVFMRGVFGTEQTEVDATDDRLYSEFAPVISLSEGSTVVLNDGVISLSGEGSIYAPCSGTVTSLVKGEDGKFTMEITHSDNFKTVLSGIDYAYAELDGEVFFNIPVGYVELGEIEMCFIGEDGEAITNYELIDNSVVWAV